MKNTFGNSLSVTIFGESHGAAVGAVLDGISPGIDVDEDYIRKILSLRRPNGKESTARIEKDEFKILSGVYNNKTTGTPITIIIENKDTRSQDYSDISRLVRPSHADFTASEKYHGFEDYRGGGHFSGRITAAICAVGAIVLSALNKKGIYIASHIKNIAGITDRDFIDYSEDIKSLSNMQFAVLDNLSKAQMKEKILSAKEEGDSVGGILETAVVGIDAGVGEPFFDSMESLISHAIFSIPAVKGIEFGLGFDFANKKGSEANDAFEIKNSKIVTKTNNSGGINGGITNGMPILFRTVFRPTPTISREQKTVDIVKNSEAVLKAGGRHDPCIVQRARIVVDCITAIAVADTLLWRYGTDWLCEK